MARDYKHRAQRSKQRTRKQSSVWRWLVAGLLVALFVVFLVFLRSTTPPDGQPTRAKAIAVPQETTTTKPKRAEKKQLEKSQSSAKKQPEKPQSSSPRFDFYTILPEKEVVIPEHEVKTRKREEKVAKSKPHSYSLQVGSFRRLAEADRRKAQLALLGIEARIETALVKGTRWNRVKIGPYLGMNRVDAIRSQLRQNHIDAVVLNSKH